MAELNSKHNPHLTPEYALTFAHIYRFLRVRQNGTLSVSKAKRHRVRALDLLLAEPPSHRSTPGYVMMWFWRLPRRDRSEEEEEAANGKQDRFSAVFVR